MPKCLEGFQSVDVIDEVQSVWRFKVEVAFASRLLEARATITRRHPPSQLDFTILGLNERVNGEGSLSLQPISDHETRVEFHFRLEASGIAAPLTNTIISKMLPKLTSSFEDCLRRNLEAD